MGRVYLLFGMLVIGGLGWADYRGWSFTSYDEVKNLPKSIRSNPGAYREMYGHRYFHK